MLIVFLLLQFLAFAFLNTISCIEPYPSVAPYVDITLGKPSLVEVLNITGQNAFTLAFVLGSSEGCVPKWGGTTDLNDTNIMTNIREFQAKGGKVIVATGGAMGPYLENSCPSVESLASAYSEILDVVGTNHLDIDIEASVPVDVVTQALAKVQKQRDTTVSFTLMVQGDDYGLTPTLGVAVLQIAKKNGLRVDIVNPMTMEFGSTKSVWGEAVISAAKATLTQMRTIWPEKSDRQLKKMLGVTPMIGRNYNGKEFTPSDAKLLLNWAINNHIGLLAFWSVSRDNGGCANRAVSAHCSSISQSTYEFTKIFTVFNGNDTSEIAEEPIDQDQVSKDPPQPSEPSTETITECKGRTESRFDYWCKSNCAMNHCPQDYCKCSVVPKKT